MIYLIVGATGSGKTWVCNQLKDKFDYLAQSATTERGIRS